MIHIFREGIFELRMENWNSSGNWENANRQKKIVLLRMLVKNLGLGIIFWVKFKGLVQNGLILFISKEIVYLFSEIQ